MKLPRMTVAVRASTASASKAMTSHTLSVSELLGWGILKIVNMVANFFATGASMMAIVVILM